MSEHIHQLTKKALEAAKQSLWQEAAEFNQQILELQADDTAALNRLAFCYLQLKKTGLAQKTYQRVLEIEKHNSIAKKYLEMLKKKSTPIPLSVFDANQDFVEEPGKTKVVQLDRLCDNRILQHLRVASPCQLKTKGRFVSVISIDGDYIGSLPEDISLHLSKLIQTGNEYDCVIKSLTKNECAVFIKEKRRSAANAHISSFPMSKQLLKDSEEEDTIFGELLEEGTTREFKEENEEPEAVTDDQENTEQLPSDVLGQVMS